MISRSRTYGSNPQPASPRKGRGPAVLRLCAGTANILSYIIPALFFVILLLSSSNSFAFVSPKTVIINQAAAVYGNGSLSDIISASSNSVLVTTVPGRTPAKIEFLQYAPAAPNPEQAVVKATEYSTGGSGPFTALGAPLPAGSGSPIDLSKPVPLVPAKQYHAGEPIFIRLTDLDQNWDPTVTETIVIILTDDKTGDQEVLRLTETGPGTGVFTGYIQSTGASASSGNSALSVTNDSNIRASYTDAQDGTAVQTDALVDPFGKILSTANGKLLDGVVVSLVNAATNQPAIVYGDDGVSLYPSTVTSGGIAQDAGGGVYAFPPGEYRFPFIAPGQYYLTVVVPAGYKAPSVAATSAIQSLPGAPFAIVNPGSRGETFTISAGPAIHIDIPLDQVTGRLWVRKTAGKSMAAVGDFVPYQLNVENVDATYPVLDVAVYDTLPLGFRYRKGSAKINNVKAADPLLAPDGRTLQFNIGQLDIGKNVEIFYVAEVAVGARAGKATNVVSAVDTVTGSLSNKATADVMVTEDLFISTATIEGMIIMDGCGDKNAADTENSGVAGLGVFLEDGTYSVSDKNGMFHFEAVKPGTHVVQLDTASLPEKYEIILCEENSRFAGSAISQFVDLQGGALWRADFHVGLKSKLTGAIDIELRSALRKKEETENIDFRKRIDTIEYSIPLHAGTVPLRNLRLTVLLPEGVTYQEGSSAMNAAPGKDPEQSGSALTYRLGDVPGDWEGTLRLNGSVPVSGKQGDMITRAVLAFDTPAVKNERTPVVDNVLFRKTMEEHKYVPDIVLHPHFPSLSADLTRQDKKALDKILKDLKKANVSHLVVEGHTDSNKIRARAKKVFKDNYELSRARAETVGRYLAKGLKLAIENVSFVGKGPDEPVVPNTNEKNKAQNRRVELMVVTDTITLSSELTNSKDASGVRKVPTTGLRPGEKWADDPKSGDAAVKEMPEYTADWLEKQQPGLAWLWPREGNHPPIPSVKIAVKHDPRKTLKLFLDNVEVDALYLDGVVKRADGELAASVWRGIHVSEGDNKFELAEFDESGVETTRLTRVVHYSGSPVKAEFVPEKSLLVADGKNPPAIAVRLTDKDGHPARNGLVGEFSIDPPYQARQRTEDLQMSPIVASTNERLKYQVGEDGIALIELQPTTATGEALIRFSLMQGEQTVRAWLTPEDRDWILVGLAEGTTGYNMATGNMVSLGASGEDPQYYENGRLAFYAKGRIKGSWLLTMAFDSAKTPVDGRTGLYQTVDPNKYYTLYGDASEQRSDAASSKKIYIKLERDRFYALFGDYNTGLSVTELSRYSRSLTGFKSEMKGDVFSYTLFASDSPQTHVKDEVPGDGTSGLYHLSRKNIVLNSETITIVTRDRFKSEVIVAQQSLSRFLDYSIDYESGTIFFKAPVFSRDGNFNPNFIVAEYESFDNANTAWTFGGRGAIKLMGDRAEAGMTYVHEATSVGEGNLTGVDATVAVTPATKVRAEFSETTTDQAGVAQQGSAYLAEVQHRTEKLEGKAYLRRQDAGFGLGQQSGAETGTMKVGGDLTYRINKPWTAGFELYRQETLGTGATRDMVELKSGYTADRYNLLGGVRHAEDTLGTGEAMRSEQIYAGMNYRVTDRLSTRIQRDQSIGPNGNVDFPTRTTVGADYKMTEHATVFADQEWTTGAAAETETTRIGLKASPWTGGQIGSTMEQQHTENGARLFATTGLKQTVQLTKQWSIDGGLDRSQTISRSGAYSQNLNVPAASGSSEDFTAVSLGTGYRQEKWSMTARVESRAAQTEDKFSTFTGANGEVRQGLALAGGLQTYRTVSVTGTSHSSGDLRVGIAYRPLETRMIILDRLDLVREKQAGVNMPFDNQRLVNNFVANLKPGVRTQVSLQYGSKYVQEMIGENDYRGYTDLMGLEARYDITKHWDVGLRGQRLHSWSVDQSIYSTGASMGFNTGKNVWISLGYNFTGFQDRDFSKADFTSQGPFIKMRLKFDQVSAREAVRWFTGQ